MRAGVRRKMVTRSLRRADFRINSATVARGICSHSTRESLGADGFHFARRALRRPFPPNSLNRNSGTAGKVGGFPAD